MSKTKEFYSCPSCGKMRLERGGRLICNQEDCSQYGESTIINKTNMTKKLIEKKETAQYTQEKYEITMPWGILTEYVFTRPNNVYKDLKLVTVARQWRSKDNGYRSYKRYEIIEGDNVVSTCYVRNRYDSEKNVDIIENKQEINLFFLSFRNMVEIKEVKDSLDWAGE